MIHAIIRGLIRDPSERAELRKHFRDAPVRTLVRIAQILMLAAALVGLLLATLGFEPTLFATGYRLWLVALLSFFVLFALGEFL